MTLEQSLSLFSHVPSLTQRAMFGGHSLYSEGRIFAVLIEGHLYLKADKLNDEDYEADGGEKFVYLSAKGTSTMNYYRFPNDEILLSHLDSALDCAHRAPLPKKRSQQKMS